jgi:hypothetical protein
MGVNVCISIYQANDDSGTSTIKFGSYDKNGFSDPDQMKVFQTEGIEGWYVSSS